MCWFEYGITRSASAADPRPGLWMLAGSLSARPGAGAWRVEPADGAGSQETRLSARALPDPRPAIDQTTAEVIELRRTRAARVARYPS